MLFFFKLPHSCDVSHISFLLFGMKVGLQMSPEAQFSYQKGREAGCVYTVHSSLALCCPLCTLKRLLSQSFCLLWELRFKSLTNVFVCWTVETTRLSADVALSCAVTRCRGTFYTLLWDLTVSPHRSGVPRTQGADPHPLKKTKKSFTWHPVNQSVSHLQKTSYLFYEKIGRMCLSFPKTNIWFPASVLLNHVCIFPQRSVFAVFSCCSSSDARVLLQTLKDAKMLAF